MHKAEGKNDEKESSRAISVPRDISVSSARPKNRLHIAKGLDPRLMCMIPLTSVEFT